MADVEGGGHRGGAAEAGEDSLYVLTAMVMTPSRFPGVLGDDFPAACAALGLVPAPDGYGLVLGQDGAGARWTVVVDDVPLVAVAVAAWDCGMEYDLSPREETVVAALPGWPLELAVRTPGVPAPHDPEPDAELAALPRLAPPDAGQWGGAQRRLGADEIALRWAEWRQETDTSEFTWSGPAEPGAEGADGGEDGAAGGEAAHAHPGVRRALREAHGYLTSPPPPGRVRSAFASGEARTLRADGPGWSLVARTDDIAYVLLDEEPGQVLPVGRGARLPALLEGLAALAPPET
ncbi:hypothetical protein G3I34_15530 [Streptomyces sp. SID8014]|uniref:hypothetical protein n=1 Tax=Streptomyces sp. SID8014 TaxID=2706097 RepID=UPI0013BD0372|nr:hypothetical protein [Streptomyces sp. SID8014]NEC13667.1 hypothetical protein [Streptomyces sp. SID8014]